MNADITIFEASTGRISRCVTTPLETAELQLGAGEAWILGHYNDETHYIEAGKAVLRGAAPSGFHDWDENIKAWAPDIEKAKAQAWARIRAARDAAEFGPFTWSGRTFDGNSESRARITLAVIGAKEAVQMGAPWAEPWKLADNSVITLSAPEMIEVARAMGLSMKVAHATAGVLAYFIDAATTPEEVQAVVWPG